MLTPSTDIYAFAIVCIEVLSMGELPWGCIPDDEIRQNVLGTTFSLILVHFIRQKKMCRHGQAAYDTRRIHVPAPSRSHLRLLAS